MKTLNLDALAAVKRTITLDGIVYEVQEMTVENFIETTKAAEALEKNKEASIADQVEATIALIKRSVPEIDAGRLRKLSLEQLGVISQFLRGELDDEGEQKGDEVGEGNA